LKLTLHSSIVTTHNEYSSKLKQVFGWFLDDGQNEPAAPTTGLAPIWMDDDWIEIFFPLGFRTQLNHHPLRVIAW